MNSGPYRVIVFFLSTGVFFILVLQTYWLRNSYAEKKEGFERTVYEALNYVSEKTQENEKLHTIRETIIIEEGDTIIRSNNKSSLMLFAKSEIDTNASEHKIIRKVIAKDKSKKEESGANDNGKKREANVIHWNVNSQMDDLNGRISKEVKVLEVESSKMNKGIQEANELIEKMMIEIRGQDFEAAATDSLSVLIKKALNNKGIFLPFEFSLRKVLQNTTDTLQQSDGFKQDKKYYSVDMSTNRVFPTYQFLWLQFQDEDSHVFARMKSSLLLSLLFSFIILGIFYYTIRLILKQKKLSEIKNDFVNNMTHELKTPIATMALALEAISKPQIKDNEERYAEYTRILKDENQKLNAHVERVLQISLLEKGALQLQIEELDLVALIQSVIKSYDLQIKEKKATVLFKPTMSVRLIKADLTHLRATCANLLDNALKYGGDQTKIVIELFEKGAELVLIFKDNGSGIEEAHQEKIFEKFFRAQGGNLHDVKGFGPKLC